MYSTSGDVAPTKNTHKRQVVGPHAHLRSLQTAQRASGHGKAEATSCAGKVMPLYSQESLSGTPPALSILVLLPAESLKSTSHSAHPKR